MHGESLAEETDEMSKSRKNRERAERVAKLSAWIGKGRKVRTESAKRFCAIAFA
jgi:hypothetical protein